MAPSLLDRLQTKVEQVSSELTSAKKERKRLEAEVELMQEENRRARRLLREHEELVKERTVLKTKLQKLWEKLDKLRL